MRTQHTLLVFGKSSVLELQQHELLSINGGSTIAGGPDCTGCICFEVEKQIGHNANNTAY